MGGGEKYWCIVGDGSRKAALKGCEEIFLHL